MFSFYCVILVIIIASSIDHYRVKNMKIQMETLKEHNKVLTDMLDKLRGFRHDYANFLISLDGYASSGNYDGFRTMSKTALKECAEVNRIGVLDPKIITNPAAYSLLTKKFFYAQELDIKMNIEILGNVESSGHNVYDIIRILGILLDNAIDAAKQTEEKIINVRYQKDSKVARKLIIIENSYNNKNVDIDKIFEKGYSSKENSNDEHGIGLWNVKKILMKNENLNLYTMAGELFAQQLEIY